MKRWSGQTGADTLKQPLWRISLHTSIYDEHDRPPEIALATRDALPVLAP